MISEICDSYETVCPYCQHHENYGGDPIGGDGDETDIICESCGKKYIVQVSISVSHRCYPMPEEVA